MFCNFSIVEIFDIGVPVAAGALAVAAGLLYFSLEIVKAGDGIAGHRNECLRSGRTRMRKSIRSSRSTRQWEYEEQREVWDVAGFFKCLAALHHVGSKCALRNSRAPRPQPYDSGSRGCQHHPRSMG